MLENKPANTVSKENSEDALSKSKIEVIKNLIFGENIQAYNEEFESVKKDILDKKKVLQKLIEETRTELQKAIDEVSVDVHVRITELEEKLENKIEDLEDDIVSKDLLGTLFIQLGEKLNKK